VVAEARSVCARALAITFDPHPDQFLRPAEAPRLLTPISERLRLLSFTGIDAVVVAALRCRAGLAACEGVCARILVDALGVRGVHEGGNFRFWPPSRGRKWPSSKRLARSSVLPITSIRRCGRTAWRFQFRHP